MVIVSFASLMVILKKMWKLSRWLAQCTWFQVVKNTLSFDLWHGKHSVSHVPSCSSILKVKTTHQYFYYFHFIFIIFIWFVLFVLFLFHFYHFVFLSRFHVGPRWFRGVLASSGAVPGCSSRFRQVPVDSGWVSCFAYTLSQRPFWIHSCFVLWALSLRKELYLNYKLRMDQAFINIWRKWDKRLRFDSITTDGDCHANRRTRLSVNRNAN